MDIVRYEPALQEQWNGFVAASRNGTFLFDRRFMDYHSDRFYDHSLMFYAGGDLLAILPANLVRDQARLESHGGLTYGGLVYGDSMTQMLCIEALAGLRAWCRSAGIATIRYKCIPHIYAKQPSEEDRYALFAAGARRYRCDVLTTVRLDRPITMQSRRKRAIRKALATPGLHVGYADRWDEFWVILAAQLERRFGVRPVHTVEEIRLLAGRFPKNIALTCALVEERMHAGVVTFACGPVLHAQYIASDDFAREHGLLDAVFDHLLQFAIGTATYFDFGISTEKDGTYLNEGLVQYKEGFGGRSVVQDFYEVDC
jgi:Acetyltransferase (GNAT) domain